MKIAISFPPISENRGTPLLAQNRQFQYFHESTYIYPMVPAYAATLLKQSGYNVVWDDGVAEEKTYVKWLREIETTNPDIVAIETKTPVIKRHWDIISDLKHINSEMKIVLMGDHVTALPRESLENSEVDYVLTGGDYDFLLLNLVKYLSGEVKKLDPGIWYKDNGIVKSTGKFVLDHNLNSLPFLDRSLTKWKLYSEKNGNFKETPGSYTMVGRDCWQRKDGGCTFCSWTTLYPIFRVRRPEFLVDEIGILIDQYGVKEIFDDTGTFPVGNWLKKFCNMMIERGYKDKVSLSCNMVFGALSLDEYKLMKRAGFRMLLFGLESASQRILDEVNKGLKVEDIVNSCKIAKEAGLTVHITIMFGYPNASREEELQTFRLARKLMENGYADTLQSTLLIPYPGTGLYRKAVENGWLRFSPGEWNHWDMSEPILKSDDVSPEEIKKLCDETYKLFWSPKYIFRKLLSIRSVGDLKFTFRGARSVMGHIRDFK